MTADEETIRVISQSSSDATVDVLPGCSKPHYHRDEDGLLVKCYHVCSIGVTSLRSTLNRSFWIGLTIGYPFEHLLWERVPGFSYIAHLLGMH